MTAPLWGSRARLVLAAGWIFGLLAVVVAWWGVSGEATTGDQFRWVTVGVGGMTLCLAASAAWIVAGLRAVGHRIVVAVPVPSEAPEPVLELRLVAEDEHDPGADRLVAAAGMRYYHRPSCTLAQGKAVRPSERADHVRAGRAACGVCRPDDVALGVSAA